MNQITQLEKELYVQLVKAIVALIGSRHAHKGVVDHMFMNPFESVAYFLMLRECATNTDSTGMPTTTPGPHFTVVDVSSIEGRLRGQELTRTHLDEALQLFIDQAQHDFGEKITKNPVLPPKEIKDAFYALERCQFGSWDLQHFNWSRKVERFMWASYLWWVDNPREKMLLENHVATMLADVPYLAEWKAHLSKSQIPVNAGILWFIPPTQSGRWQAPEEWDIPGPNLYDPIRDMLAKSAKNDPRFHL